MKNIRITLTQLPASAHAAALAAAQTAFPGAKIVTPDDAVRESDQRTQVHFRELLILSDATSSVAKAADGNGIPQQAMVILGRETAEYAETVPPEDWTPALLTRVFRLALQKHELFRENLRLRGDLKTIARRLNHDLATPVGCIHTSSCVLKIIPPDDQPSIAAIIQNIEDSSGEISRLVERVSFVLKASADPYAMAAVEMGDVMATVLSQLEGELRNTGATVILPESWPKIVGVSKWLEVIWWNFLENALKHGGGRVEVRITWNPTNGGFRFWIADNGSGVPAVIKEKLFAPFEQLHKLHTPGLGLSLVQRLVVLQGGDCGYDKMSDGRMGFHFTLPAAEA